MGPYKPLRTWVDDHPIPYYMEMSWELIDPGTHVYSKYMGLLRELRCLSRFSWRCVLHSAPCRNLAIIDIMMCSIELKWFQLNAIGFAFPFLLQMPWGRWWRLPWKSLMHKQWKSLSVLRPLPKNQLTSKSSSFSDPIPLLQIDVKPRQGGNKNIIKKVTLDPAKLCLDFLPFRSIGLDNGDY